MSEIQRWNIWLGGVMKHRDGAYVLYTDHLEIVKKLKNEIVELKKEIQRRDDYIERCLV